MAPFTGLEATTESVTDSNDLKDNHSKGKVLEAMNQARVDGQHVETAVEADVIGPKGRYVTNTVTKYGKNYYNFTGLRHFKEKFNPDWEPRYIGIETGLRAGMKPIKGLTDTTLLISGGLSSLVRN